MPRFFEHLYRIAVLGGVGCTLVAGPSARAQDAATVQQSLLESASSTSVPAVSGAYGLNHPDTFAAFIQEIGFDDLASRKEAITGDKQFRVDWNAVNHNMIGLSDDQWATAYAVLLDGSQRVVASSGEHGLQVRTPHADVAAVEQRVRERVLQQIEERLSVGVALDAD